MLKKNHSTRFSKKILIIAIVKYNKIKTGNSSSSSSNVIDKIITKIAALTINTQNKLFNWFIRKLSNNSYG